MPTVHKGKGMGGTAQGKTEANRGRHTAVAQQQQRQQQRQQQPPRERARIGGRENIGVRCGGPAVDVVSHAVAADAAAGNPPPRVAPLEVSAERGMQKGDTQARTQKHPGQDREKG